VANTALVVERPSPRLIQRMRELYTRPYWFALLVTLLGLLLRFLLDPWLGDQMPYITFVLAVAVTGLYVGVRPALASTALGAVFAYFSFVEPRYRWGFRGISDAAGFAVYVLAALVVVALVRQRIAAANLAQRSLAKELETQRKLTDMEALLKAFMDKSPACAYLRDSAGKNVFINETAAAFEFRGERDSGAQQTNLSSNREDRLGARDEEVLRSGQAIEFVETLVSGAGEREWLTMKFPFADHAGRRLVGSISFDITERIRAEEVLRKTESLAAAGQMASLVAHEINNPLACLTNSLFLLRSEPLTTAGRYCLTLAEEQLARVSHITRLTLSFYKEHESATEVRIRRVASSAADALQSVANGKGVKIERDFQCEAVLVAREDRVRDLFANLLLNAVESGAQTVRIRVARGREWQGAGRRGVRISIIDDGSGIDPKNRLELFKPFFSTKTQKGAGLGLWASKAMVLRGAGSIRLRSSTRTGTKGTCVSVFLPTTAVDRARDARAGRVHAAGLGGGVMTSHL
jgi:signal transduction histidine kinase